MISNGVKKSHVIGIVVIAGLCIGVAVLLIHSQGFTLGIESTTSTPTSVGKSSGRAVPAGEKEYYNPQYKFSLLYPNNLTAAEHDEGAGAMTIIFEYDDKKTLEGFQVFIVPFSGSQITDDRFKQDIPSGVRKDLKEIKIDGATGASFYSENDVLGETAEVWFLRGGYLFEVNTFKELAPWLDTILQTWKFTP
mgnify:CR=1 FL=1